MFEKAEVTDIDITKTAKFRFDTYVPLQGLLTKALKEREFEWPPHLLKMLKFILAS